MRKVLLSLAATLALAITTVTPSWAQDYPPGPPIKIMVPAAPGGTSDYVARFMAEHLTRVLGQPVIVEHKPGAGGIVGASLAAKAPADGRTLLLGNPGPIVFGPAMTKVPYTVSKDFVAVGSFITFANTLLLNPQVKANNMQELIELAKRNPGKINFASPGNGQSQHLSGEMMKRMAGVDMVHVAYKGTAAALTDLIAGQVQMMFGNIPTSLPFIQSGQLRAIAVTGAKRSRMLPGVPTAAESGLPGFIVPSWVGLFVPTGTPQPLIDRVHAESEKAWASPEGQQILARYDLDWTPSTQAGHIAFVNNEITRWTTVIKDANIKAE